MTEFAQRAELLAYIISDKGVMRRIMSFICLYFRCPLGFYVFLILLSILEVYLYYLKSITSYSIDDLFDMIEINKSSSDQSFPFVVLPYSIWPIVLILNLITDNKGEAWHSSADHKHQPVSEARRYPANQQVLYEVRGRKC